MKSKTKTIWCSVLATILSIGAIGGVAYGVTYAAGINTKVSFEDDFKQLEINLEQSKVYTGEALTPDVSLPEGFTATYTIYNSENKKVDEAIEIGTYRFEYYVFHETAFRRYVINFEVTSGLEETIQNSKYLRMSKPVTVSVNAETGEVTKEVTYIVNGDLDKEQIEGSLEWVSEDERTVEDYVSFSIDKTACKVTFTCKRAFDKQIVFRLFTEELYDAKASMTIDYQQKMLTQASINVNQPSTTLMQGLSLNISITDPTYSIGTIDYESKPEKNYSINFSFSQTSGSTFKDLVTPSTSVINWGDVGSIQYKGAFYYKNGGTGNRKGPTDLVNAIGVNIVNWFENAISTSNLTFNVNNLKSALTYSVEVDGPYTSYATDYSYISIFENLFKNTLNSGGRMTRWGISAYGQTKYIQFNEIDFGTVLSGSLNLGEDNIIF